MCSVGEWDKTNKITQLEETACKISDKQDNTKKNKMPTLLHPIHYSYVYVFWIDPEWMTIKRKFCGYYDFDIANALKDKVPAD